MLKETCSASPKNKGQTDVKSSNAVENYTSAFPPSFSNLSLLKELNARAWYFSGRICDDFERLVSLESLDLSYNNFSSLPSSLKGLSVLENLDLSHCRELRSLPPLPSSLQKIVIADCQALEEISDISDLTRLKELNMANCEKLRDVPGLQCLKSLRWLYMTGCSACSSAAKSRFSKISLRNLRVLSMPGNDIPSWLVEEEISYIHRENYVLKAILICVVISTNQNFDESLRERLPVIPNIKAQLITPDPSIPSATTTLRLMGIPRLNEDQVYFYKYLDHNPLVFMLRDGCKIRVENVPRVPGVELKRSGIYLSYEIDDDYDGDEASLDERHHSISERLARFLNSRGAVV